MRKQSIVPLTLVMVLGWGIATAGAAQYLSTNLGGVWVEDSDYSFSEYGYGPGYEYSYTEDGDFSFEAGYGFTLAAGNDFGNGVRAEIEFGFRSNDLDDIDGSYQLYDYDFSYGTYYEEGTFKGSTRGDVTATSFMANLFYDFLPAEAVTPFLGMGIGLANVDVDTVVGSEEDTVLAYQLAAGFAFALNPNTTIDLQYRYFATDDPEFQGVEAEYATHNLMIGLRFGFY
jgi:opacity protein-like surface antigen